MENARTPYFILLRCFEVWFLFLSILFSLALLCWCLRKVTVNIIGLCYQNRNGEFGNSGNIGETAAELFCNT